MRGLRPFVALILLLAAVSPGSGNGPRSVAGDGQPMRWNTLVPIVYHRDAGTLGTLTNAAADALVADAFGRWAAVSHVQLTFSAGADIADVNAVGLPAGNPAHWGHFWRRPGDGLSPVMYDADGSIIDQMFGAGARFDVLGAAGLDTPIGAGPITEASIVINGAFFDGLGPPGSPADAPTQLAFEAAMVHEVGHFLNLDHSLVNHELGADSDPDNDRFVPTMYPLTVLDEEAIASLNPDDEAGVVGLYPAASAATARWELSGSVSRAGVPFQGAEIVVRKNDDPLRFAYAAISGQQFQPCSPGGACYPCDGTSVCDPGDPPEQGTYVLFGLTPGDYTVCVEQLDRNVALENGTFVGPLATPPILPGPEECWNTGESGTAALDDPDAATTVTAAAGADLAGYDVALNALPASDPFEPNNSLGAAAPLAGAGGGGARDTVGAVLGAGDRDVFSVNVVAGHQYAIDLDAAEIGSSLDPVIGLYDNTGALIAMIDDAVDPDSGKESPDPARDYRATFTGALRIVVSSFPDTDLDGVGGGSTGPYWLRVIHDPDADGDGIADGQDVCPNDAADDADRDGICGDIDNCPAVANANQANADHDFFGDVCDGPPPLVMGWTVTPASEYSGGHFGHRVVAFGDFNFDGFDDFAVTNDPPGQFQVAWYQGSASGPVHVDAVQGSANADVELAATGDYNCDGRAGFAMGTAYGLGEVDLVNPGTTGLFGQVFGPMDASSYGASIAMADVNGDSVEDLIVGQTSGGPDDFAGNAFAYHFNTDCSEPDAVADWTATGEPGYLGFGGAVEAAGDVNSDGFADVLVFAYRWDGPLGASKVYLYLGSASGLENTPTWGIEPEAPSADFGIGFTGAGDVNGDGYDDVIIGVPGHDGAGLDRGRIDLFLGSAAGLPLTPSSSIEGFIDGGSFGSPLEGVGDLDNDGYDDVVVAAPVENGGARGHVYLFRGFAGGLSGVPSAVFEGEQVDDGFGGSIAAGDINGDGYRDVLIGAWDYDGALPGSGRVYVLLGTGNPGLADSDADGIVDAVDNCPRVANPTQVDTSQAEGPDNVCDTYDDNVALYGTDQECGTGDDLAGDGAGDACVVWSLETSIASQGIVSNGAAWADVDGDDDLDVWLTGFEGLPAAGERLLRNDGGAFTDITPAVMNGVWYAGAWADYDGDGDDDLLSAGPTGLRLLRNGSGVFTPVSLPGIIVAAAVAWVDYDLDGDLDAHVPMGALGSQFLRNDGGGLFTLVAVAPLDTEMQVDSSWADYDADGDMDVFIGGGGTCRLFRNDRVAGWAMVHDANPCASIEWGDFDGDGDLDAVLDGSFLRNQGNGSFSQAFIDLGGSIVRHAVDQDRDGDLDIVLNGGVLRNNGGTFFGPPETEAAAGVTSVVPADVDEDGRVDLLATWAENSGPVRTRLVTDELPTAGHWIEIDLEGTASNRSAIGARVRAVAGGAQWVRQVTSAAHPWQAPRRLHIGLGPVNLLESLEIRWPSGVVQTLSQVPADRRIVVSELDGTAPGVTSVLPPNGAIDVSLYTNLVLLMSEAIDPESVGAQSIGLSRAGAKVAGTWTVSTDRFRITFDPDAPLDPDADYQVQVNGALRDLSGNGALSFVSTFDTGSAAASAPLPATAIGAGLSGRGIGGADVDDNSGFATAAVGDVNGDGRSDLLIGAPNSNVGTAADAGRATLVFGGAALHLVGSPVRSLDFTGEGAAEGAGWAVAPAGDMNEDGLGDFIVGAPQASSGTGRAGKAYLVFGNAGLDEAAPAELPLADLAACSAPILCGVVFTGQAQGDQAGFSVAAAGDINDDGHADLLIGAPGAGPGGAAGAGIVYLVFGPLPTPGVVPLATVGETQPGRVFHGEAAGDGAGTAVSRWDQFTGDGIDDLLIGAPGADATDEFGVSLPDAGYVYAIHGGTANLVPNPVSPATIALARVASGNADQVHGVVFIGSTAGGRVGRSVSGAVSINGDSTPDIVIGADQQAWIIPGDGPKTLSGTSKLSPNPNVSPSGLVRSVGIDNALGQFGATVFTPGLDGNVGGVVVAVAGDVNNDGVPDLVFGAGEADLPGKPDAGKAYVIFGRTDFPSGSMALSDVGSTFPGAVILGAETGDHLGASVGGGFDVTADGVADVIIGAPFADSLPGTPSNAGETYVFSLAASSEVARVDVSSAASPPGAAFLEWTEAARATGYNVYRGLLSGLRTAGRIRTSDMFQLACGLAPNTDSDQDGSPDLLDAATPAVGDGFFYLVTARNLSGESTLGAGTPPRLLDAQCP